METINSVYQWLAQAPVFIQVAAGMTLFFVTPVLLILALAAIKFAIDPVLEKLQ